MCLELMNQCSTGFQKELEEKLNIFHFTTELGVLEEGAWNCTVLNGCAILRGTFRCTFYCI